MKRLTLGLSLAEAGKQMGLSAPTLFRIERGNNSKYDAGKKVEEWLARNTAIAS